MYGISAMFVIAIALAPFFQQYSSFEWNKKSTLSSERRIEFPGIVLEPGVYVVRLRESGPRRSLVEILNQDESQILAVVVALPDHRMRPEIDSEFTFHLARPGFPTPVQTWYYAGDMTGLEFVYPKSRAKEIARESEGHVMASNDSKDAVIVAITPNGKEVVIEGPLPETAKRKSQ